MRMHLTRTKAGTYTIYLTRHPSEPALRWRTGIPTLEEALKRAQVAADLCGYTVDKKVRGA